VIVAPNRVKVAWHFRSRREDHPPELVRQRIEMLLRAAGLVH
jgi:hypothetical protein